MCFDIDIFYLNEKQYAINIQNVLEVINIPEVTPFISSIIAIVPLQLLAYYISKNKGLDVDKPRNLAKSVTVE